MTENIIEVRDLTIEFPLKAGTLHAVDHVDFDIPKGQITALVGESGSGKSTMAMALLKAVSVPGVIRTGTISYKGEDILKYSKEQLLKYKWAEVSMVFQSAQNALNPVMTIKEQMIETVAAHNKQMKETDILKKASQLLEIVRLEPSRVLSAYPHELSGGMKQRVMIAFSLLLDPELVILDEPTTALDVITQDYIFDILKQIHKDFGTTMLLLTHDIGVVAKVAEKVGVMYAGKVVEIGDVYSMFDEPAHPYTKNLISSAPSLDDSLMERKPIVGSPPNLFEVAKGCPFMPRCSSAKPECADNRPEIKNLGEGHKVACYLYEDSLGVDENER